MDGGNEAQVSCLRLRGLPFSVTTQQVHEFFAAAGYSVAECLITRTDGKPNGQAFVLLPKAEAVKAQLELNNRYIGKRFIEIFTSTLADMETARRLCAADQPKASGGNSGSGTTTNNSSTSQRSKQAGGANNLHIIRLRGLPFSATPADIKAFLAPIELPDGVNSIQMVRHPDLRPTGEAYVHLSTETEVMQALNKHKQSMGKRYIEVFPSCLAELQQSMTPPRPMGYQQMDQSYTQGRTASGDLMHAPLLGLQSVPTGNPVAQAEWLQRQQQLMQLQQQMQLQAAAQQKALASLQQQRQQHQAASLRMHAHLQAHAQGLPSVLQQLQLNDIGSGAQQDTLSPVQGLPGLGSPQQQQQMLVLNGLNSMQSGNLACSAAGGVSGSAAGMSMSLSSNVGSGSSYTACYGLPTGMPGTSGGLSNSAAAAAMATCSPSPLDTQYVPFFCSGTSAPMTALMLQEAHGLQAGRLQMFSPSGAIVNNPVSASSMQQHAVFGAEVLSSSANAVDSGALGPGNVGSAGAMTGPAAFCSDTMLQGIGIGSGPLTGFAPNTFLSQGMGRADVPGSFQEWLS